MRDDGVLWLYELPDVELRHQFNMTGYRSYKRTMSGGGWLAGLCSHMPGPHLCAGL